MKTVLALVVLIAAANSIAEPVPTQTIQAARMSQLEYVNGNGASVSMRFSGQNVHQFLNAMPKGKDLVISNLGEPGIDNEHARAIMIRCSDDVVSPSCRIDLIEGISHVCSPRNPLSNCAARDIEVN